MSELKGLSVEGEVDLNDPLVRELMEKTARRRGWKPGICDYCGAGKSEKKEDLAPVRRKQNGLMACPNCYGKKQPESAPQAQTRQVRRAAMRAARKADSRRPR